MKIVYKSILFIFCFFTFCISAFSQIGYQVSLLNTSTGEPRANVSVKAGITITDADDGIVFSGDQFATTNDFGVLSLTVGDSDTFSNVDWNKLPFYISVTVDDVLIGRSQILNVPVAEYAKQSGPVLTKEMLVGKRWVADYTYVSEWGNEGYYSTITFYKDYLHFVRKDLSGNADEWAENCEYFIQGENVFYYMNGNELWNFVFLFNKNEFVWDSMVYKLAY